MIKTIDEIAEIINGKVIGDGSITIKGIAKIEEGSKGKISFLANPRYEKYLENTESSVVIVPDSINRAGTNLIQVEKPDFAFRRIVLLFYPPSVVETNFIHSSVIIEDKSKISKPVHIDAFSVVEKGVEIGKNTRIGSHSYIGQNVKIGDNVLLHPRVTIMNDCVIGSNNIIQSGTVLGSDGFGYVKSEGKYLKIPQVGNVVTGMDVEIGANCTIDRSAMGSTIIEDGCILDNMIHIAHNVVIGKNTALAAQTGIAGSTKIGENVSTGGQVGIVGHIEIGKNTILGAKSAALKSVPENSFYFGYPAMDHKKLKKIEAYKKRLPDIYSRLKDLEKRSKK
ncbi:UDP-3-O-(3-hydroxymyristoyl)glucosamine N-acyltransferase [candidate division KSB1 bacterium]